MKHLRITVEGKVYDVAVEIVGAEPGTSGTQTSGRLRSTPSAGGSRSGSAAQSVPAASVPAPASTPAGASAATAIAQSAEGAVCSPLAALVVSIDVAVGDEVKAGDRLVTLEAMKMNTIVNASHSGKVTAIHVAPADGVDEGQALVSVQ